ncbi:glycosyltransferase family 4 protein [Sphingomonas sp. AOB5]|uniref:glycosyltransferase family 4 protein n=1 Tax=Sphingomonas sp. AOB5 TaxID=3034017 RepID=UPI0023F82DA0|nr:glycosyltransferase family 4 protein [Sphingomonas sp. AOB5]MDF7774424.1 glycosyltransferase family 4 protein [Sphingomonas sp. AOB5]
MQTSPSASIPASLKHVVIVNDRAVPKGGASAVALQSAVALARAGVAVTVFAGGSAVWGELDAAGVRTVLVETSEIGDESVRGKAAFRALWNRGSARGLTDLLNSLPRPGTVVHVHSWSKGLSPSIFAAAERAGVPIVATLHDYGFVCPNAGLHDFPTGKPCMLRPMSAACLTQNCDSRSRLHKLWRIARQLSLEQVARAPRIVDRLISVTAYAADIYRPLLPKGSPLTVLPNPIDATDLGPADPAANADILFIGRLSREKGTLILAEAAARRGLAPVFVGEGELADEVLARCPQATVTGWLDRAGVTARLRSARAVVLPATWRETQGMVVPEALANGVPVVVSSGTAPASAVRNRETGLVFENGSVDDLARVLGLLEDDDLVHRMGRTGYDEFWREPPDMARHLSGLLSIYAEVLAPAKAAAA